MISRNYTLVELKKRISICKERLDALKDEGFSFSNDIYNDLESLKNEIMQPTLRHRIWVKKNQVFVGIASIVFILTAIYLLYPTDLIGNRMTITVDNIYDGMIINESFSITGTASYTNEQIQTIQVKIDEKPWENATGTVQWSYLLNVDNILNGYHVLSFQCTDGQTDSVRINKTIVIQKESTQDRIPTVAILHPSDEASDLTGVVFINGTASAVHGEIQEIKIRFDNNPWITIANASTIWHYSWETTALTNGYHQISVQCSDTKSNSSIISIGVYIFNTHEPVIPPFPENGYFQLYIPPSNIVLKPNITYEQIGYYRGRVVSNNIRSRQPVYMTFEIDYKPDYLNVILPKDTIVTNPDEVLNNFSLFVEVTEEADMNRVIPLSLKCIFTIADPQINPFIATIGEQSYIYDIFFYTGQW